MDAKDVFKHYRAAAASSGQKKDNKRARGESSKAATKKARTDDPPATAPMKENSPPPPPPEQPALTSADQQPSPKAPSNHTLRTPPEGSLPSLVVSSARERIYKLSKHRRSQAAITDTASMEADQVLNRGLNEIVSGRNFDSRLADPKQALETKNNELDKQNGELLGENTELSKQKAELLEDKATLTKELLETRDALKKANESREKFRESAKLNYQDAVAISKALAQEARDAQFKLKDDLKAARLEFAARDVAIQKIPELESRLEATLKEVQRIPEIESKLEATSKEIEVRDSEIRKIQKLNAKLKEEKKMTFEVIEGEKARLLEEFKTKKDRVVHMAMYQIWINNTDLDTSFLANLEIEFIARWHARLEKEEARLEVE
ncbi:uncharacterized protein LOC133805619 [Humulus lupulus]|uniref:uncharacterized protein LOC133805619 n=1 Tax=Humulus lupulus TaxID=3486 RepID=UPI002B41591E|nr:uncharacterized protein LOC133805619 [Humulus lupulus]